MSSDIKEVSGLEDLYENLKTSQASAIYNQLKKCPPDLLQCFIANELQRPDNLLSAKFISCDGVIHIGIKCWKKGKVTMQDIRSILGASSNNTCQLRIVVSTTGFTMAVHKFQKEQKNRLWLINLKEFITARLAPGKQGTISSLAYPISA